jgi:hypothetical protein
MNEMIRNGGIEGGIGLFTIVGEQLVAMTIIKRWDRH